jgi:phytoene dehydrogenase-like protein
MAQWLHRLPRRSRLRRTIRNVIAGIYAVNLEEVPAHLVVRYFVEKGAFRRFGYGARGTVGVWDELAAAIQRMNGEVRLNTTVHAIMTRDGHATGVEVERDGHRSVIACRSIISDAGASATLDLLDPSAAPDAWATDVRRDDQPAPMIVVDLASRRRLVAPAGGMFFADTDHLCAMAHMTEECPDLAPPGWHLYVAFGVPVPALSPYDVAAETQAVLAELSAVVGGLHDVRILRTWEATGASAAVRAPAGRELSWKTPIDGLLLAGDAVREPGDSGMEACVAVGEAIATELLAELSRRSLAVDAAVMPHQ